MSSYIERPRQVFPPEITFSTLLTEGSEALRDGCEDIQEHRRLQVGDEAHVVLGEAFQERVVRLAQLPILLQHRDTKCQATEKRKAGTVQGKWPSIILERVNLLKQN